MRKTLRVLEPERVVGEVKKRYGSIARGADSGCCGSGPQPSCCSSPASTGLGYADEELASAPAGADLGLGCGAPLQHLAPESGEVVLDLGSGGGLDAFLAAKMVGGDGRVIGVDMTPDMLHRARAAAERAGYDNVEFREGRLEALPLDDASVDAVTSNCVVNLVPDKAAVFREVARVLRSGGRVVISDIVLDGPLPEALANDLEAYASCVSGALLREEYFGLVRDAGLSQIEVLEDRGFGDAVVDEVEMACCVEGSSLQEVAGKVRSVTYRARKV